MLEQSIPKTLPRKTLGIEILYWPHISSDKVIDFCGLAYAYHDCSVLSWYMLRTRGENEQT